MTIEHEFITSYTSKIDLLNFIKQDKFFYKMVQVSKLENYDFVPDISNNLFSKKYIKWPQSIIYNGSFNIFNFSLPDLKIIQEYRLLYDELTCKVTALAEGMNPMKMDIKINFYQESEEDNVKIKISCEPSYDMYIPEIMISVLLEQLDETLTKIFS